MKRILLFLLVLALMMALCGCGKKQQPASTSSPSSAALPGMTFDATHPLGTAAARLLSPYEACLRQVDATGVPSISHQLPEDMFTLLIHHAAAQNITPKGGRYAFTTVQTSTNFYEATAMEATAGLDIHATPAPGEETPMDLSKMGDYSVKGGGVYHRTYLWDVQEDLSCGTIEIITTLNGENAGHETFSFAQRSDGFYFVDAAPDLAVSLDTLQSSGTYLVAVGRLTENQVEVVEYHVENLYQAPQPQNVDFDALKNTVQTDSYLFATKDQVIFE